MTPNSKLLFNFRHPIFALLGATFFLVAIAVSPLRAQDQIKITTTTAMLADVMREVGGKRVDASSLMGPGVDPHAYRQTRSDIAKIIAADVVIWHGLYLEAQLEDFFASMSARKPVYALAETLSNDLLLSHEDYAGRFDPHVWMSPPLWAEIAHAARDILIKYDPEHQTYFKENAAAYISKLEELERYARAWIETVPNDQRILVSAHDAFQYFGAAYDFEVLGIQGISTESEAGLKRIEDLVSLIVERNIPAVFVETSVADRNVRALIEGARARGAEVKIGGTLYSDSMGEPGTYEGSYIGMIDHNATTIAKALGGHRPDTVGDWTYRTDFEKRLKEAKTQ